MTTLSDTSWSRTASADLCLDLVTILACNAYGVIENNDHAFDFVTSADHHIGTRTRFIDAANEALADKWLNLERTQRSAPEGLFMHSEEATRPWRGTETDRPWLLQVDEFDGTTIATGSAGNWAVSALAFVWSPRRRAYSLSGGAIACHDGHVVKFNNTRKHRDGIPGAISGDVWFRRYDLFTPRTPGSVDAVPMGPANYVEGISSGTSGMVAINAAAGSRGEALFKEFSGILTGTQYRTVCAGTPIIYGAIRGQVSIIIDPEPATLHDANHLFPLAFLGWRVCDLKTLEEIDILRLAEANSEPGGTLKPIPPCIAIRSDAALEEYRRLL